MDTEDFFKKIIATLVIATLVVVAMPQQIYAQGSYALTSYDKNFIEKWRPLAQKLGKRYGIPYRAALTQWLVESDRGRSYAARTRNNLTGQKVPGSTENQYFSSQSESIEAYFKNVSSNSCYTSRGSLSYPMNSYGFLSTIAEVYCPGQGYYKQLEPILSAVMAYEEEREAELEAEAERQAEIDAAVEEAVAEAKADTAESVLEEVEKHIYQQEYNRLMAEPSRIAGVTKALSVALAAANSTDNTMLAMRKRIDGIDCVETEVTVVAASQQAEQAATTATKVAAIGQ